jgi:hypothetical protein
LQREPAESTSIADVIVGALGVTGALALVAVVCGAVLGLGLALWRRRHPVGSDRLPPVSPQIPVSSVPPSSQAR